MSEPSLRILQVSTFDMIGGAEKIAWNLFQSYRARGYGSWLAVGHKLGNDPDVLLIPNEESRGHWYRFWREKYSKVELTAKQANGGSKLGRLYNIMAEPGSAIDHYRGVENFRFPGTKELLKLTSQRPNILHCHNLHGEYFDLRLLPWLSEQLPVVLTLHDAWLLSGHCAHSLGCERWTIGCGQCPDLRIEPSVTRDATAYNWKRKRAIYQQSHIYVSTPSRWLLQKIERSMLMPGVIEARVIPNGVDLTVFHPHDKQMVRFGLDIPQNAWVLLFTANHVRQNRWKDYPTFRAAMALVAEWLQDQPALFIALGDEADAEHIGHVELRFVPYQSDSVTVARYYQAADVYIHATKVDTFPNTILEALTCGTPVVATAVGGISEQIADGQTGYLTPAGDAQALARRIIELLSDDICRKNMSIKAAADARSRFDLQMQVSAYLEWYQMIARQRERLFSMEKN